jgi:methionyl-tRNA formyltransferase
MKHNIPISAVFTHRKNPNENIWFKSVSDYCSLHDLRFYFSADYNNERIFKIVKRINPKSIFSGLSDIICDISSAIGSDKTLIWAFLFS